MKKIISTGAPIDYALTSDKRILIDTVVPVEVSDEEFAQIQTHLGSQVHVVNDASQSTPNTGDNTTQSQDATVEPVEDAVDNETVEEGETTEDETSVEDATDTEEVAA